MSGILVKLFATALTMSQVAIQPDNVRTSFDPVQDRGEVERILKEGCAHMRRAFDIEEINLDELITTAMDDPDALTGNLRVLQGLSFSDLHASYRQFCTTEQVDRSPVDLGEVITYFNEAVADLPDAGKLKGLKLPGVTVILDQTGKRFAEVYEPDHRRMWAPLSEIPKPVQQAFVAAEDKRFYEHKGIDERGVIRAFMSPSIQSSKTRSSMLQRGSSTRARATAQVISYFCRRPGFNSLLRSPSHRSATFAATRQSSGTP